MKSPVSFSPAVALLVNLILAASTLGGEESKPTAEDVRKAASKSLPFIEAKGVAWIQERRCVTCHQTTFLIWTHNEARQRGLAVDDAKLNDWTDWALLAEVAGSEGHVKPDRGGDTYSQFLLGRDTSKRPARWGGVDPYENLLANLFKAQAEDGHWTAGGQSDNPPEISTGWAMLALLARDERLAPDTAGKDPRKAMNGAKLALVQADDAASTQARQRAQAFLDKTGVPKDHVRTEGLAVRVVVEHKCAPVDGPKNFRKELVALQNADGGWPANPTKETNPSDAFATGQSLWALSLAGLASDDPVIQRGVRFLLNTQQSDGSWDGKLISASLHPQGNKPDREASLARIYDYWGTAWATLGLLQTLPPSGDIAKAEAPKP
jgi:squalene-hopene/tetraprenyl-beta-curcumene cyclase